LLNPGFETFTGTADDDADDVFDNWANNNAGVSYIDATTVKHGGTYAAKLHCDGGPGSRALFTQTATVSPLDSYEFSIWTRGDGTRSAYLGVEDATNSAWITDMSACGVSGTTYAQKKYDFLVPATCTSVRVYVALYAAGDVYVDDGSLKKIIGGDIVVSGNGLFRSANSGSVYKIAGATVVSADVTPTAGPTFDHLHLTTGPITVAGTQVVGARAIDARLADTPNSGDATTDGIIAALQALVLAHGLGASS
jgi:hypothetical protein